MQNYQPAILYLEDGRFFSGYRFGAAGETTGELCFNTGMTGYQEILTDPSYCRQIVTMTSPHIGNYGVNADDVESSRIQVAGFVIKEETIIPSNWQSTGSIGEFLLENSIVGIQGIDTRALTKHLRNHGAQNGIISTIDFDHKSLKTKLEATPSMTGLDLARDVSTTSSYHMSDIPGLMGKTDKPYKISALDFGIKWNILRLLDEAGCDVTVYPANTSAEELIERNPDGLFLSNGPGDPAAVTYAIDTVQKLLGRLPMFGICLGHQILALSLGAKTYKLKFGHRGLNHPVKRLETGQIEITSQNHGFAVDIDSLPESIESTHINLNDNTCEGIRSKEHPAFSVQYHPESSPGPHDSRYLFKAFTDAMEDFRQS